MFQNQDGDEEVLDRGDEDIDRSDAYAFEEKLPQCLRCKNWNGKGRCEAFPDGIPHEILIDEFDHKEPHPDDNGIQFEAKG